MRRNLVLLLFAFVVVAVAQTPQQKTPYWAYAVNPPDAGAQNPLAGTPRHVPNSNAGFTDAQIRDLFGVPDWHPSEHPPMPDVVAHGRKPDVFACAYCHLPNGEGRPENSTLAGLPAGYIVRQVQDFKTGARKCSEPLFKPAANMPRIAAAATDQEIRAAAQYFSEMRPKVWIRVIESATVPVTHVSGWMLVPSIPSASEPIGHRIIEMPENVERTELRDDDSGFVAYVPEGSLKAGKLLVTSGGNGKTVACAKCHGPGLRGSGNVPAIAGRSPSYIVRQLYDIQSGARSGVASRQMRRQVANLNMDDMIAIAAFVSSLKP
jgi:cytochrome c553